MRIFFALLMLGAGGAMLLAGYRLARFIIPLWGFIAGLSVGGAVISAMNGTPFLGTVLGVLIGLVVGLFFAAFSYLYYAIAVVVLIGAVGYWAGNGFITFLGFNPGFLSFLVGAALGIAVGLVALVLNAPKYTLIVATALGGAISAVGGVLLLFNQIPLESFSYAAVNQSLSNSFVWTMVALVLTVASVIFQNRTTSQYAFDTWAVGRHETPTSPTPTHSAGVD